MSDAQSPLPLEPLPDMVPGSRLTTEWDFFRRERPRLLAEGQEGRWVLIKGQEVVGIWDTRAEAFQAGYERAGGPPFLVQQVLRQYPTFRGGNYWRCRP